MRCHDTLESVRENISNEVKESPDAPFVKELVSDEKLEKKTVFPTAAKKEFVRPKQEEKPLRKPLKPRPVNAARSNSAVVNAVRENQVNAIKALACWVWRPTKPNGASITLKRYNYIDVRGRSKNLVKDMLPLGEEPKEEELLVKELLKLIYKNKKDERGIVVRNKARLVTQGYTQEEGIDYDEVFAPVVRIEAIRLFLAYASFKDFIVYQMAVESSFLYGKIKEEVYICQTLGIEDPEFPNKVYKMSSIGELTFFLGLQYTYGDSKPLLKDAEAEDVDVHLYRSMIGSLMYLTSSRPDIMFDVCACARFRVTPKVLHLHAMKRIFRYLKVQPILGLWYCLDRRNDSGRLVQPGIYNFRYPNDSSFDLEAYTTVTTLQTVVANSTTEAEYVAAASCCGQVLWIQNQMLDYGYIFMNTKIFIDNESTICIVKSPVFHSKTKHIKIRHHFIKDSNEKKLSQMIKIHTYQNVLDLLSKATTKVKTVNREEQIQALVDKKMVIITETSVRNDIHLGYAEGTECLPTAIIFEQMTLMGYENLTQKLTFCKAFFSPQWKFLIHTILQCLSAKTTAWNEFSSTMASVIICLATNQKFNFSKYIFDHMLKNLEGGVKLLMFSRFVQVFLDSQVKGMLKHKEIYVTPSHTKKIFAKMKRQGKEFSGSSTRVESSEDVGLDDQEDGSKQERMIIDLDTVKGVALVDETQGINDQDMFDTSILNDEEVVAEKEVSTADRVPTAGEVVTTAGVEVSTATITSQISMDEITLAKVLIDLKTSKPKAKGIVMQEPNQIMIDEEVARILEAQMQVKLEKEERLARKKEEEANIALIKSWDNTHDMMDADYELAARLQEEERGEVTIEEKSRLFMELMDNRKKYFARLRAKNIISKPPTKTQKRNQMCTYLKNIENYKHSQLKNKSFKEIQMLFNNTTKWIESFVPMDTKLVRGSEKVAEGSSKRVEDKLKEEDAKRQRIEEENESA
nr:hypothetical protein [Tanacetum cinerariifolium]